MFYKFIWNGKPDKIKRKTVTKSYLDGGLKMIDIKYFLAALKITWVRRMYTNSKSNWDTLARHYLGSTYKLVLLGNNYSENLAKKTTNAFWADVAQSWSSLLKNLQVKNSIDILNDPLWCNYKMKKTELFYPKWFRKGIILIADLFGSNGELLSQRELEKFYSIKTNFLEYFRVTSAVKVYLKEMHFEPKGLYKPVYPNQVKILCNSSKGSQDFYKSLNHHSLSLENSLLYWKNIFNLPDTEETWRHIFQICHKTVMDNDLIWLQIRVLYKILGTNDHLLKIKRHENGKCNFCHNHPESILHLFVECQKVKQFWSELKNRIQVLLQIELNINPTSIILGCRTTSILNIPLNAIYLSAKKYIFKTSRKNESLSVTGFIKLFEKLYQEQEYVAKLEFKHNNFRRVWGILHNLFIS